MSKEVSPRQLAANRANAQRSTGRGTPRGKAVSSQNARKLGLAGSALKVFRGGSPHSRRLASSKSLRRFGVVHRRHWRPHAGAAVRHRRLGQCGAAVTD